MVYKRETENLTKSIILRSDDSDSLMQQFDRLDRFVQKLCEDDAFVNLKTQDVLLNDISVSDFQH
jgi:hypothetical protein